MIESKYKLLNKDATATKFNLLQILRGVAAMLVVCTHGDVIFSQLSDRNSLLSLFEFGVSGVDFFFVLSGFIILYVHHNDINQPKKTFSFLKKRFIRIYPIYWLVLSIKLLSLVGSNSLNYYQTNIEHLIKAYTLFPQDEFILRERFIGLSWTLSYEVFFYLVFCTLIFIKPKIINPIIGLWLAIVLLNFLKPISFFHNQLISEFLFSNLHLEFIAGCCIAYLVLAKRIIKQPYFLYIGLFLYALSIINTAFKILSLPRIIGYGIPAVLIVIGLVIMEVKRTAVFPKIFVFLGNASYSIYLIHGFVMSKFLNLVLMLGIADWAVQNSVGFSLLQITSLLVVVLSGSCMYLLIEKPLITSLRKGFL